MVLASPRKSGAAPRTFNGVGQIRTGPRGRGVGMAEETEELDKLVAESSYVFKATITQLNASNEPTVRPGPGLIVAHVDDAFRASPSVGVRGLRGREVTMRLAGGAPALGEKLLVFANEWVYGAQIALREVATTRRQRGLRKR